MKILLWTFLGVALLNLYYFILLVVRIKRAKNFFQVAYYVERFNKAIYIIGPQRSYVAYLAMWCMQRRIYGLGSAVFKVIQKEKKLSDLCIFHPEYPRPYLLRLLEIEISAAKDRKLVSYLKTIKQDLLAGSMSIDIFILKYADTVFKISDPEVQNKLHPEINHPISLFAKTTADQELYKKAYTDEWEELLFEKILGNFEEDFTSILKPQTDKEEALLDLVKTLAYS